MTENESETSGAPTHVEVIARRVVEHLDELDDVRMVELLQYGDLAVDAIKRVDDVHLTSAAGLLSRRRLACVCACVSERACATREKQRNDNSLAGLCRAMMMHLLCA